MLAFGLIRMGPAMLREAIEAAAVRAILRQTQAISHYQVAQTTVPSVPVSSSGDRTWYSPVVKLAMQWGRS
jgi:DNA-binding transcriptional regulator YbjK